MSCVIIKFFQVYTNYIHFLLVYNLLCMQKPIYMIYVLYLNWAYF